MNLIKNKDGSVSLNCSVEDMQKVICALSYIRGTDFDFLWNHVDRNSPLHPDNCYDLLTQVVEDVDLVGGYIKAFMVFELSNKEAK